MKKLLVIFLLFPFASFAQCPTWSTADSTLSLKPVIEKYLQFTMQRSGDTSKPYYMAFADETGFAKFSFAFNKTSTLNGTEVTTTFEKVKTIMITGPADRIEKLYNDYFLPLLQPCEIKHSDTWITWNNLILVHIANGSHNGIPMGYIRIEKKQ